MKVKRTGFGGSGRRGAALLYAAVVTLVMAGLCMALLAVTMGTGRTRVRVQNDLRAFFVAEAGLSDGYVHLTEGLIVPDLSESATIGTAQDPIALGPSSYWAEIAAIDSRSFSVRATGTDGRFQERLELIVSEVPSGFFQYAAFGANGVVLDSNAFIDSYDSAVGSYESQVKGGNDFAKENGHVGSNADILLKANTEVHGDAIPGPGHVVDDSAPNVYVSGSTEPAEEEFELPPIEIPDIPTSGTLHTTSDVTLGPGLIHYDSIQVNGGDELTFVGPATIVVDDFIAKSNSGLNFDAEGGPVQLYASADFVLESNSTVTTLSDSALDVTLFLAGDNLTAHPPDRLELGANSEFIGAIYAPNAEFSLASNFDVYGSIICGALDLSSFGEIHFDEALLYDGWGSTDEYEAALWHKLPLEQ